MFKRMRCIVSISLLIVWVVTLTTTIASAKNIQTGELEVFLDNMLGTKLQKYHIPNATVSVVKKGEIVYKKGFGFADIEENIPVDADTSLFRIGSTSKLITWTAVMQLVEDGKLDLDTDVNHYLDFEIPPRLVNSIEGITAEPITLTHLMTHTPGFEDYPDVLFRLSADKRLPLNEYIRKYLPSRIFPAGEVAAYSNYGTALAGYIVERASGLHFAEYVEKNIFQPLEMNRSTYRQPLTLDLATHIAKPYRFINGVYVEGDFEYILPEPAGSMSSTASDMTRFMIAHLDDGIYNGGRILKEETIKKMHKQHFTNHPDLGGMTLGFMEGIFNNQGVIFHGGGTMLYSTGLYLLPEEDIGIFMSYSGGNHLLHSEIFQEFMDYYYPAEVPLKNLPHNDSKERAKKFIGEYQMNRRSITTDEKSGSLFMGVIHVDVDEDGYLLITNVGETNQFIEIEPGVYQNLREGRTQDYFGPFHKIIFKTDPYGRVMLTTDGPMTYSKAPFYATMGFTLITLIIILFILIGSLVYWIIRRILVQFKQRKIHDSKLAIITQWIGICFSIAVLVLFAGILSSGETDPVYQLPKVAYMPIEGRLLLDFIAVLMMISSLSLVFLSVIAWWKNLWKMSTRIHYTLFTLAALGLMWISNYWNLFK
ncbi:MAG: penicillin-binding protein beta-lactamase class [Anaerosolibacter sp.]|jgi:CubicO group peptidase (beta-lactamase class C family)|uniref:serine hydrolase domain-containing protein n=1 Tax=Anaerosolibacter sp. TaxID=1872527 RepID=UPI0026039C2B|nr:serine hydrolase domain-containing protein [Anaerosolibacter sp.]MDF2546308.1 penicillin-binding protein beta-lactamase class [Anaerosolibacter sp.]